MNAEGVPWNICGLLKHAPVRHHPFLNAKYPGIHVSRTSSKYMECTLDLYCSVLLSVIFHFSSNRNLDLGLVLRWKERQCYYLRSFIYKICIFIVPYSNGTHILLNDMCHTCIINCIIKECVTKTSTWITSQPLPQFDLHS